MKTFLDTLSRKRIYDLSDHLIYLKSKIFKKASSFLIFVIPQSVVNGPKFRTRGIRQELYYFSVIEEKGKARVEDIIEKGNINTLRNALREYFQKPEGPAILEKIFPAWKFPISQMKICKHCGEEFNVTYGQYSGGCPRYHDSSSCHCVGGYEIRSGFQETYLHQCEDCERTFRTYSTSLDHCDMENLGLESGDEFCNSGNHSAEESEL